MTELWLVRHGQTDWNVEGRLQGQADPPLNSVGWREVGALAHRLQGMPFAALYASDLLRATQTAQVLSGWLGLPVQLDRRLREVNHGEWDGMLTSEVIARFPDEWARRMASPLSAAPPGGETLLHVADRTADAANDIAEAHPGRNVLVISHGLALAALICQARGHPLAEAFDRIPPNAKPETVSWPPR